MIDPQFWWYLARASGFVAWGLLTTAVVWGLLLRTGWVSRWVPRGWMADVHRFLGVVAVLFTGLHVTGLVLDDYVQMGLADIAVPFAAGWRPVPVALGVLAGYLAVAVTGSSLLMRRLPRRWWHRIHLTSYVAFWLATVHGITAGTDSGGGFARAAVAGAIVVVTLLTVARAGRPAGPVAAGPKGRRAGGGTVLPPRFHRLTVADVRRETPDAVSVAFRVPRRLRRDFTFRPGQHLVLRTEISGRRVSRAYSICSSLDEEELRIAVRHAPGGRMSSWINTALRPGDVVEVAPPSGSFTVDVDARRARHILGVAAGSGITPVLSIIASVLAVEPRSRCTLVYGNRSAASTLFATRLADLAIAFPGRLRVVHVRSREFVRRPTLPGRVDAAALAAVHGGRRLSDVEEAFVCGPPGMAADVRRALVEDVGLAAERVHVESYSGAPIAVVTDGAERTVLVRSGRLTQPVTVAPGESVLDAGLRAGMDLPYSCRAGICGTCVARMATRPDPTTVARGEDCIVLACQTPAPEGDVVIDFGAVDMCERELPAYLPAPTGIRPADS